MASEWPMIARTEQRPAGALTSFAAFVLSWERTSASRAFSMSPRIEAASSQSSVGNVTTVSRRNAATLAGENVGVC